MSKSFRGTEIMRKKLYLLLSILFACAVPVVAYAHQPSYIDDATEIAIPDPVISRAYYGELAGKPAIFTVALASSTQFYLNILAPDMPGARTDFDATMRNASGTIVLELAHGPAWPRWYEEFAGDYYLKGPEMKMELPADTYTITVHNPDDRGKYVLAPGEEEAFTLAGVPETLRQTYLMKTIFFEKPSYAIFEGIIGHALLGILIAILVIAVLGLYLIRVRRSSHVAQLRKTRAVK